MLLMGDGSKPGVFRVLCHLETKIQPIQPSMSILPEIQYDADVSKHSALESLSCKFSKGLMYDSGRRDQPN